MDPVIGAPADTGVRLHGAQGAQVGEHNIQVNNYASPPPPAPWTTPVVAGREHSNTVLVRKNLEIARRAVEEQGDSGT